LLVDDEIYDFRNSPLPKDETTMGEAYLHVCNCSPAIQPGSNNGMIPSGTPQWLDWAREIHALAKTSQHYAANEFERQRSERLLGIAGEIIHRHTGVETDRIRAAFDAQSGYVTPKVDVRAAVFDQGRLLLVQDAVDGGWTLPGGWADVGDRPSQAIEREVLEEAGLEVDCQRLIGVYDANRVSGQLTLFHAYKLIFLCELLGGMLRPSLETTAAAFFSRDELPEPLSARRTTQRHIQDAFRFFDDPSRPAVID
jgi:ADP-ribose pyrophosphatase YjhB (NUDIX family)